ncbi:MAG: hypothetical protein ACK53P_12820, partial [Pseudanabaena sp.]
LCLIPRGVGSNSGLKSVAMVSLSNSYIKFWSHLAYSFHYSMLVPTVLSLCHLNLLSMTFVWHCVIKQHIHVLCFIGYNG